VVAVLRALGERAADTASTRFAAYGADLLLSDKKRVQCSHLGSGCFATLQAELTVQTLSEMIKDINNQIPLLWLAVGW